jgi:N-acetylglucosamine-6-sulfatase
LNNAGWKRRGLLVVVLTLLAVSLPYFTIAKSRGDGRPDMVVVMVDDLGAIDERILDRLPNIKELWLDGGLRFDAAYSETPLCCPGRASFLTGQHTRTHGVVYNSARLLDPRHTIATSLHDAGYYTIMAGKYLNYPDKLKDKTPDGWDKVAILRTWLGNVWSSWWVNGHARTAGYHDRYTLQKSLQWLRNAPSAKPVFMWLADRAPHWSQSNEDGPIVGRRHPWKPDVEAKYEGDPRCDGIADWHPDNYAWKKRPNGFPLERICRSLLTVDEMVGKLRKEMAAEGRNPVWMFTSDNGMAWGVDGYPLKNVPQAGRLPVYFAGKGIDKGHTDALVSNIDFGPTLAKLAGTTMPFADGVSFANVLHNKHAAGRDWMLEDHPLGGFTGGGKGDSGPWWGIRTPNWHYEQWKGPHLYDLRTDPLEIHDISAEAPGKMSQLQSLGLQIIAAQKAHWAVPGST